jgi:diguanylate cyclase (GGDEF)-like protein
MLDMNRLKELNDTHGHAAGDTALRTLVARCKHCLRAGDFIGRLSGDEFAIFLPDADEAIADEMIRAIRAQLDAGPVQPHGFTVAASFGVATADGPSATLSQLLQAADQAMYAEKHANRRAP